MLTERGARHILSRVGVTPQFVQRIGHVADTLAQIDPGKANQFLGSVGDIAESLRPYTPQFRDGVLTTLCKVGEVNVQSINEAASQLKAALPTLSRTIQNVNDSELIPYAAGCFKKAIDLTSNISPGQVQSILDSGERTLATVQRVGDNVPALMREVTGCANFLKTGACVLGGAVLADTFFNFVSAAAGCVSAGCGWDIYRKIRDTLPELLRSTGEISANTGALVRAGQESLLSSKRQEQELSLHTTLLEKIAINFGATLQAITHQTDVIERGDGLILGELSQQTGLLQTDVAIGARSLAVGERSLAIGYVHAEIDREHLEVSRRLSGDVSSGFSVVNSQVAVLNQLGQRVLEGAQRLEAIEKKSVEELTGINQALEKRDKQELERLKIRYQICKRQYRDWQADYEQVKKETPEVDQFLQDLRARRDAHARPR